MKLKMTNFSLKYPWLVVGLAILVTMILGAQFPKVSFDNDPENMLSKDEPIRVFHNAVKEQYSLYDFVIVGIVNDSNNHGVFNVDTLQRIYRLTGQLLSLQQGSDGAPIVTAPKMPSNQNPQEQRLDLNPQSAWKRILNVAFRHDPHNLFDKNGDSAIINRELISPSVVDNIKQADLGSLKLEYLMEQPPTTQEEALTIREDAMSNPLYKGTLVSEDEKAICIYIPIQAKTYSYNVATLVRALTADWPESDRVFITGQPVAQDTFGVEMLVQMASSAPMAGLAIFLLLLMFFRRISLIIAPMLVAIVSVICTMGLLIGLGFDVHIMSSMIAIFLMPISVADAVHILSEFYDVYHRFNDKRETIRHVISHLFMPMLYTSLTTMAGFASLGMTPIPPVRIFGLHVAFGVGLAWLLTMTLIPAYIMIFIPEKMLACMPSSQTANEGNRGALDRFLEKLGAFSYRHWKLILGVTALIIAVSAYGITRIQVNDNPVKWFTAKHEIRVADEVLNKHFGGTYTAYLTLRAVSPEGHIGCAEKANHIAKAVQSELGTIFPEGTKLFMDALQEVKQQFSNVRSSDIRKCFVNLIQQAEAIDEKVLADWNKAADEINYADPNGLTRAALMQILTDVGVPAEVQNALAKELDKKDGTLQGEALQLAALEIADTYTSKSFRDLIFRLEAELTAPAFKQPEMLRYIESLQNHLEDNAVVGKTSSAVDALQKASYELQYVTPPADASEAEVTEYENKNKANFSVPDNVPAVGQVFIQLEGMKKKDSLFHMVTRDYQAANIWVQLKSGDNRDMEAVVADTEAFMEKNPPPLDMDVGWAGLTYLNVVWQDKMVRGMLSSLGSSFVVVLIMMMVLFRSPLFGILSMIPLSVTIALIYGLIGLVGKDYDMPVAVLSALTLGLSVDFAIHFLERARELQAREGSWKKAVIFMFKEPAMAISRNAITISVGFTPLLVAPLVPYKTVGFFLATIMAVSWFSTLFILSALVTLLEPVLFRENKQKKQK
jgi:predicted RND superfamily exporter protein